MVGGVSGPVMEIVCSRMRYMGQQLGSPLRIVALSTPLTNARDVTGWLGCSANFNFAPNARPTKMDIHITGFNLSHTASRLAAMVRPVYTAITRHCGRVHPKPALVFVPGRRQTRATAVDLLTLALADRQEERFLHTKDEAFVRIVDGIAVSGIGIRIQIPLNEPKSNPFTGRVTTRDSQARCGLPPRRHLRGGP